MCTPSSSQNVTSRTATTQQWLGMIDITAHQCVYTRRGTRRGNLDLKSRATQHKRPSLTCAHLAVGISQHVVLYVTQQNPRLLYTDPRVYSILYFTSQTPCFQDQCPRGQHETANNCNCHATGAPRSSNYATRLHCHLLYVAVVDIIGSNTQLSVCKTHVQCCSFMPAAHAALDSSLASPHKSPQSQPNQHPHGPHKTANNHCPHKWSRPDHHMQPVVWDSC